MKIWKQGPVICCLQETHFTSKDIHRLKVKEEKNIFYANQNKKWTRVALLTSDKTYLMTRSMSVYNDQGINSTRRLNNYKGIYTSCENTQVYKIHITKSKSRDKSQYNNSRKL
jgi:exonuclease III